MTTASTEGRWDARRRERQAANLLGALALALSDRLEGAVTEAAGLAESDAIALSALHHFLRSPRVDLLAQVLGLSSSGTVRLVDRLETAGFAHRAVAVTEARRALMEQALGALTPAERRQFGELAGKILASLVRPPGATRWTCRLCDLVDCGRPLGRCPVYEAAKTR